MNAGVGNMNVFGKYTLVHSVLFFFNFKKWVADIPNEVIHVLISVRFYLDCRLGANKELLDCFRPGSDRTKE